MNKLSHLVQRGKALLTTAALTAVLAPVLATTTSTMLLVSSAQAEQAFLDRIVAVVDQDVILQSELQRRTEVVKQQLLARNTTLPDNATLTAQVLDKLIVDRLQLAKAQDAGIRITDQTLNRTLEKIASSNGLSLEQFKQQVEAEGQVYREVREQIRTEMLITQARERIVNSRIKVSEQEVKNFLASEQGQERTQPELHLAHIMIPIPNSPSAEQLRSARAQAEQTYQRLLAGADFAETSVAVSKSPRALEGGDLDWRKQSELPALINEAIKGLENGDISRPFRMGGAFQIIKLLDKRGGAVQMVEQFKVRHILIKATEIRSEAESEQLIRQLRARIVNGEDFADIAKQYSDDTGSGSLGGELGWALPGQMVPAFEDVMKSTPVGQLSPAFKSRFGWHILQVQDRKEENLGDRILANEAREIIRRRKFGEELDTWLREIRSEAYVEVKL